MLLIFRSLNVLILQKQFHNNLVTSTLLNAHADMEINHKQASWWNYNLFAFKQKLFIKAKEVRHRLMKTIST